MPTMKQMEDLWDAEMWMNNEMAKINSQNINLPFTGEVIGIIQYDPETKDLKIIVTPDPSTSTNKNNNL